jgi:hypothetical protein
MKNIYLLDAKYKKDFIIEVKFNTQEIKQINLKNVIYKYKQAQSLRDVNNFKNFYLDDFPTLAWENGFDLSPNWLYDLAKHNKL